MAKHFRIIIAARQLSYLQVRSLQQQHNRKPRVVPEIPPANITRDWIGPAHPISNLLRFKVCIPEDESEVEKVYRERRIRLHAWNQDFWETHNMKFYKLRDEYIKKTLKEKYPNEPDRTTLNPPEMWQFYKEFLDDHYAVHLWYNKEWYKKNISLLWPALKVTIYRFQKKLRQQSNN